MQETPTVRAYPFWLTWANRPSRAIGTALALELAVLLGTLALEGHAETGWQAATRHTARVMFPFFLVPFVASSLARLWPGPLTRALLARRRAMGLAFATAISVHIATLIAYSRFHAEALAIRPNLIGGALAFTLVLAMAATSNDAARRALGTGRWRALHTTGQVVLFAIFSLSYFGRVSRDASFWPAAVALAGAAALRLTSAVQSRRLRSSTLPIE